MYLKYENSRNKVRKFWGQSSQLGAILPFAPQTMQTGFGSQVWNPLLLGTADASTME